MKAGKKKNRNTAEKITKFPLDPSGMEDLEDAELDALLEEELKREADELEARLNSDPKLIGVGASDDLFAKIVGSLKEQGVWEEDEEAAKEKEDGAGEADAEKAGKTESENREIEAEYEDEKSGEGEVYLYAEGMQVESARAGKQNEENRKKAGRNEQWTTIDEGMTASEKTETEKETAESTRRMDQRSEIAAEKTEKRTEKNIKENIGENTAASADKNIQNVEKIKSNEVEEKNTAEDVVFSDKERNGKSGSEETYSQLSEADRRAMEYGYQMQQKDAEKKVRRKKRRKIAKRTGITAAALVAVFGVSMTSDANRRYVLEAWNTVAGSLGMRTGINYLEEEPVYVGNTEEEAAKENIKEKLEINPIRFGYLPEGWKFMSYEIDEESLSAAMFYSNEDKWMTVYMYKNQKESVMYNQFDGETEIIDCIETEQNIKVKVYKNGSESETAYTLMFEVDDNCYYCNIRLSFEDVKKIAKYLSI